MTRDKLVFNEKALKALRKHPAVIRDLEKRARRIAAAAGGEDMGYKVTVLELEDPRARYRSWRPDARQHTTGNTIHS